MAEPCDTTHRMCRDRARHLANAPTNRADCRGKSQRLAVQMWKPHWRVVVQGLWPRRRKQLRRRQGSRLFYVSYIALGLVLRGDLNPNWVDSHAGCHGRACETTVGAVIEAVNELKWA